MKLPFSESAFLDLFGLYNQAQWPLVIGAWLVSLAVVICAWRDPRAGGSVPVLLAAHWLWSGVVYHWLYFRTINPAAVVFAGLFVTFVRREIARADETDLLRTGIGAQHPRHVFQD